MLLELIIMIGIFAWIPKYKQSDSLVLSKAQLEGLQVAAGNTLTYCHL